LKTLIVGASGATGQLLVAQLLATGKEVKIIARSTANIPESWLHNEHVNIIYSNISEMKVDKMTEIISDCNAFACCLGHNLTFKGLFGKPRKLVTNAVQLICEAISKNAPTKPTKFVLMNTAGNRNRDINEPVYVSEKTVLSLLRFFLPPHLDNEEASDFLRLKVGKENPKIEWAVVRPDTLIDENQVTDYNINTSPTRSAIFNPGETSRINVAHFMSQLILEEDLWNEWKGQMPVIYND